MPLITIGLPFYNSKETIKDAVKSIFAQTLKEWELIIIDDGSTDDTIRILRKIEDERIKIISDGKRKRLAQRLNEITRLAKTKYIVRMDADDIMHPDRIEKQLELMEYENDLDVIDCAMYSIDEKNEIKGLRGNCDIDMEPLSILKNGLFMHPTVFGKREWFLRNPYNEEKEFVRCQDRELWVRTIGSLNSGRLKTPLYYYRENNKQSFKKYRESKKAVRHIVKKYGKQICGMGTIISLTAQEYIKEMLFGLMCVSKHTNVITDKRYRKVTQIEKEIATEGLKAVSNTIVPGWKIITSASYQ